jgi:VRR-NUC domain-containing protein
MTERELQAAVTDMCHWLGLRYYHTHDSRRSNPGFPDLVIVGAGGVLFAELKSQDGRLRPEQKEWLHDLHAAGAIARVWYPDDLKSGAVSRELKRLVITPMEDA